MEVKTGQPVRFHTDEGTRWCERSECDAVADTVVYGFGYWGNQFCAPHAPEGPKPPRRRRGTE